MCATKSLNQWPLAAPSKRNEKPRTASDTNNTLTTLLKQLMPTSSARGIQVLFSEVQRQFALPRLPTPCLNDELLSLKADAHPGIHALSPTVLAATTISARASMSWRWLRFERLNNPRLPQYERDPGFVQWLQRVPDSRVEHWRQRFLLAALGALAAADARVRLLRLRPMPLEVLQSWHERQVSMHLAGTLPGETAVLDYVVSACLQRMDVYYLRVRQMCRRTQASYHDRDILKEPRSALYAAANGQLTISDDVFATAEQRAEEAMGKALAAFGRAHEALPLSGSGEQAAEGALMQQCERCREGGRGLARSPKNLRYPPFVLGCTCHFAFSWEGEPAQEAPYEGELQQWARMWTAQQPYPFPARQLLFKVAEAAQCRAHPGEGSSGEPGPL